jgi:phytoene/squalene synthetase
MFSVATINFLQDVAIDQQKERIYLPMEDLSRFAVSRRLRAARGARQWSALMRFRGGPHAGPDAVRRAAGLRLRGRIGWDCARGARRLAHPRMHRGRQLRRLPAPPGLEKRDWLIIFWRALRMSRKSLRQETVKTAFPPSPTL